MQVDVLKNINNKKKKVEAERIKSKRGRTEKKEKQKQWMGERGRISSMQKMM